ncbi:unnamed protein product [Rhodiola kirilowii]
MRFRNICGRDCVKLDQPTLYELHYQMITFGKVFCKKRSPYCNACPLRASCKYFASAYVRYTFLLILSRTSSAFQSLRMSVDCSAQLSITDGANSGVLQSLPLIGDKAPSYKQSMMDIL